MSGIRSLIIALVLTWAATSLGQPLTVGSLGTPTGNFGPGPLTVINLVSPAARDGIVTSATFEWSAAPCPAAAKIKFYHLHQQFHVWTYVYLGERGPFDVRRTLQTVLLNPPFAVHAGDLVAVASVTSCGGPVKGDIGGSVLLSGDDVSGGSFGPFPPSFDTPVLVEATDSAQATDDAVVLLKNRFRVTLAATDPRTGRNAAGRAVPQGDRFGYFSLPDFTGDPEFPEVIIKMADATALPPPFGGSFWFFYSSLTDVQYTLTVTDQVSGKIRTYSNISGGPRQLCGGADTSAFPP
jgi:hypothetical protein